MSGFSGLPNFGNTCYINTVVQCLFNNPCFKLVGSRLKSPLAKVLCAIMRQYKSRGVVDLDLFYSWFKVCKCELEKLMDVREQNDIQEFFLAIINKLIEQEGDSAQEQHEKAKAFASLTKSKSNKKRNKDDCFFADVEEAWWRDNNKAWSSLVPVFTGQNVSQIKCASCGYFVQNAELFTNIDVDIGGESDDIVDMLSNFFAIDHVDGWKCDKCNSEQGGNHCVKITRMPKTLTITLKRFDPLTGEKKNDAITIPKRFELPSETHVFSDDLTFTLFAIGCHQGNQFGGHYYAALLDIESDKWYIADDEAIAEMTDKNCMAGNEPYMLFYTLD